MLRSSHASHCGRLHSTEHASRAVLHAIRIRPSCTTQPVLHSSGPGLLAVNTSAAGCSPHPCSAGTRAAIIVASSADAVGETSQHPLEGRGRFSTAEHQQLWDSVSRSLLKLGKAGASDTHARSLCELLGSHKLVKVQLNGAKDNPQLVARVAANIVQQADGAAELLQTKGVTMLFANSSSSKEELLAIAEASAAGTALWKAKRAEAAADRRQQRKLAEAKREAGASRSRKRIGQMITSVAKPSKGPMDKATLVEEWKQLAAGIVEEEADKGSSSLQGVKRKAPWKK
eukprot:GHUV01004794.1.p1 GENE.GHUV01004794.1~~GHUV01004794.1.p1  ORF type:complete len:287 (+),score=66.51 GHUV01004794.1:266-1126(+)